MAHPISIREKFAMAQTLGKFILEYMEKHEIESANKMAELVGVASSTLNGYINSREVEPSMSVLLKLSKATNTPLVIILAMAYPDVVVELGNIDPDIYLLARELSELPQVLQDGIKRFMRG